MSDNLEFLLAANRRYMDGFGTLGMLDITPRRGLAILTCMDARLDPARFLGLDEGDAHIIRNAGGRASDDAIRSLIISHKLLGTREWLVIHHTDCEMETVTDGVMRAMLRTSLDTARWDGEHWHEEGHTGGSVEAEYRSFLPIDDRRQALLDDVERLRSHPLVPRDVTIIGCIYDVATGGLAEVVGALRHARAA